MFKSKKLNLIADFSLLFVALVWGSGFVATKNALDSLSPMYVMSIRFTIAFLLSCIIFIKKLKKINKNNLKAGIIIGIFLFLGFATQTIGLQYTLAGKQAFLTGTNVVMVPFIFWIVKKNKPDNYNIIAAFIMLLGIALLTLDINNGFVLNYGDILTLLCALFFACHIVSIGIFTRSYDPIVLTIIQFGTTALLSIIWVAFTENIHFSIPANGLYNVVYLGVFSTFIAFLIQNIAQKYTSPTHTAIILCMESVFGSILSVIFLDDKFTSFMIIGCIVIFIAIITAETKWGFLVKNKQ